jgi:hypothetical protein
MEGWMSYEHQRITKKEDRHRQGSINEGGDDRSDNIHMKELKQIVILIHDP